MTVDTGRFDNLKAALPPLLELISGWRQETPTEYCSPCPRCGGDDRFRFWPGEGRFWCRGCNWRGDVADLVAWREGCSLADLCTKYFPNGAGNADYKSKNRKKPTKPARDYRSTKEVQVRWSLARTWDADNPWHPAERPARRELFEFLCGQRKIARDVVEAAITTGTLCQFEMQHLSVVLNNSTLLDEPTCCFLYRTPTGDPCAIQHVSISGRPLHESGALKVFERGHNSPAGFFYSGAPIDQSNIIIFVEAPVNALSITTALPEVCAVAFGSTSGAGRKVKLIESKLTGKKLVAFFDNDQPGRDAALEVAEAFPDMQTYSVEWDSKYPAHFDANDILKGNESDVIIKMIQNSKVIQLPKKDEPPTKQQPEAPEKQYLRGFETITLEGIYTERRPIESIIAGLWNVGDALMVHADGGTGKSLIVQDLAMFLAWPFNGDDTPLKLWGRFDIPKPRATLFVQSENSQAILHARVRPKCDGYPLFLKGLDRIFFPRIKNDVQVRGDFSINQPNFAEKIRETIEQIQNQQDHKIDILVVDPLISYADCDENSNREMRAVLDFIGDEVCRPAGVTLLLVHHNAKDRERYRGATSLWDYCRTVIGVSRSQAANGLECLKFTHEKANNTPRAEDFTLLIDAHLNLVPVTSKTALPPSIRQNCLQVKEALRRMGGETSSQQELIKQYVLLTDLKERSAKSHIKLACAYDFIRRVFDTVDEEKPGRARAINYILGSVD